MASHAIALARTGAARGGAVDRTAHVGYYLIDQGRCELESATSARPSLPASIRRMAGQFPQTIYLGTIALLTAILTWGLLAVAWVEGLAAWALLSLGSLVLLAGSQLAVTLVNWLVTLLASPQPLPRLDFSAGIPLAVAHAGGRADPAHQPHERREPGRGPGGPLPGQSRRQSALRPVDRLWRRG